MDRSIVFLFSGQGSQYFHMGEDLYRQQPRFRYWVDELDMKLFHMLGYSICAYLFDDKKKKSEPFDQLMYSHPAIFILEVAMARFLMEKGIRPDYMLGASLGEYAAAAASGWLDTDRMLEFVAMQALWVEQSCTEGRMLAILHDRSLFEEMELIRERSTLAADNYVGHFVVSGETGDLKRIEQTLRTKGIASQMLPVSYAFHSPLIDPVREQVQQFASSVDSEAQVPHSVYCSSLPGGHAQAAAEDHWWKVVREPIQFREAVSRLENRTDNGYLYIDLGPSGTLASFVRYNLPQQSRSEALPLLSPFSQDSVLLDRLLHKIQDDKPIERV
ncbi:acyltransferase domain-containing protein [Paenibacillus kobensis]|uniref:acyltransferase domain-containing protein n=1 Tax=Paenibacillus kobensis TaxID=59841 RepID=UPI000FDC0927|nr:acyltransferase domain-containing protein [Paenibacillus kobensis]